VARTRWEHIGFDAAHDAGDTHVGLSIMRERAYRIGAEWTLESAPGQGTLMCLVIPHRNNVTA